MPTSNNIVQTALWFVETYFNRQFEIEAIAEACGVSTEHVSRTFAHNTGQSVMSYARRRRLTEAAKYLQKHPDDILAVALEFGYGSSEAFSRAFKHQFSIPPSQATQQTINLCANFQDPITLEKTMALTLNPPRFETHPPFVTMGLKRTYSHATIAAIPKQWEEFTRREGEFEQLHPTGYGICADFDPQEATFDYYAAVEVDPTTPTPQGLDRLEIPEQNYAVFTHKGHVSEISKLMGMIGSEWFPTSEKERTGGPEFEKYLADFDPETGTGTTEIWIPIK